MASDLQKVGEPGGDAPMRRPWESMSVTKIGKFEDVLGGGTVGSRGDGGATKKV